MSIKKRKSPVNIQYRSPSKEFTLPPLKFAAVQHYIPTKEQAFDLVDKLDISKLEVVELSEKIKRESLYEDKINTNLIKEQTNKPNKPEIVKSIKNGIKDIINGFFGKSFHKNYKREEAMKAKEDILSILRQPTITTL